KRFSAALKKIGINNVSRSGEPISAMAQRLQQEVDLPLAACEFGLTPSEFEKRLDSAGTIARTYAPLRVSGGTVKREVLFTSFARAAKELGLANETPDAVANAKLPTGLAASVAASVTPNEASRAAKSPPAKALVPKSTAGTAPTSIPTTAPKAIPGDTNKPGEIRRFRDLGWGVKSLA